MTHKTKLLAILVLGIAALGTLGAPGAVASEFKCAVEPCRATLNPDGTSFTAHHVFVVKDSEGRSISFTCNRLTGQATSASEAVTEVVLTDIAYDGCNAQGATVLVRMNGCDYLATAAGQVTIEGCEGGKAIEAEITETGCIATIGEQGPLNGLSFHNLAEEGETTEVTTQAKVPGIAVTLDGSKAQCNVDPSKTPLTSEYKTGNTIATGEPGRVDLWWVP